jgi:hypothetical protein
MLQNDVALMLIRLTPLFDFFQRPETTQTNIVIIKATVAYTRKLVYAVAIDHLWPPISD